MRTRPVIPFYPGEEGTQLSANFTAGEFKPRQSTESDQPWFISMLLIERLQLMRDLVLKSMTINSGFRTWHSNRLAAGKPQSRHLIGYAADIAVTPALTARVLACAAYACGFRRIGVAKGFVHVDVDHEPSPATWSYDGTPAPSIESIASDAAQFFPGESHPAL